MKYKNNLNHTVIFIFTLLMSLSSFAQDGAEQGGNNNGPRQAVAGVDQASEKLQPGEALERFTSVVDPQTYQNDVIITRPDETGRLVEIFIGAQRNNALTTGESGDGKSVLILEMARELGIKLPEWQVRSLDLGAIIADASYVGEFEGRVEVLKADIIAEAERVEANGGKLILAIDEAHRMLDMGGGAAGNNNILNQLKDFFNDSRIRLWLLTTNNEARPLQNDTTIARRTTPHNVGRMTMDQVTQMVFDIAEAEVQRIKQEFNLDINVDPTALDLIAQKAADFMPGRTPVDAANQVTYAAFATILKNHVLGSVDLAVLEAQIESLTRQIKQRRAFIDVDNNAQNDEANREKIAEMERKLEAAEYARDLINDTESLTAEEAEFNKQIDALTEQMQQLQRESKYEEAGRIQYEALPAIRANRDAFLAEHTEYDPNQNRLDPLKAARAISMFTQGVPTTAILNIEAEGIRDLESRLADKVIGHTDLIARIRRALITATDPNARSSEGPMYSAILDGPTGTGKTEVVKQLAHALGRPHVEINMSRYAGQSGATTAWGSDRGIVGSELPGEISEILRNNPNGVIELQEMDQADSKALQPLYDILENDFYEDKLGRKIDLRNIIIIGTTNASARYLSMEEGSAERTALERQILGDDFETTEPNERKAKVMAKLQVAAGIAAPIQGRINSNFDTGLLTETQAMQVSEILVNRAIVNPYKINGIDVNIDPKVYAQITMQGYNSDGGGRSMTNIIDDLIRYPLAQVSPDLKPGYTVNVDFKLEGSYELSAEESEVVRVPVEGGEEGETRVENRALQRNGSIEIEILDAENLPTLTDRIQSADLRVSLQFSQTRMSDVLKFISEAARPIDTSRNGQLNDGSRVRRR